MKQQNAITKLHLIPNKGDMDVEENVSHTSETSEMVADEVKKQLHDA